MTDKRKPTREARLQKALHRLGTNDPRCCVCGEVNPHCLEQHHISGRHNDQETTCIICRNCHRKVTDSQKDHPDNINDQNDELSSIAHFMLGLADLLELIVEKLREFAEALFGYPSRNSQSDSELS